MGTANAVFDNPLKSDIVANSVAQQNSSSQGAFEFEDKRQEAMIQRKFNTLMNSSSRVAAQRMQINNKIHADNPAIQRMTDIRYGPTANFHYDWPNAVLPGNGMLSQTPFATFMTADLDVNQPVRGSGATQAVAPVRARHDTQTKYGGAWVLGHLLNDDLGGLGIVSNLAPITHEANMEHYFTIERRVKNALYRQPGGGNFDLANAGYLQYVVNVAHPLLWSSATPDVDYNCAVRTQVDQGWVGPPPLLAPILPAVAPVWNPWWIYTVQSRHDDTVQVPPAWASSGGALRPGGIFPVQMVLPGGYVAAMGAVGGGPVWHIGAQAALVQNSGTVNAQVIGWQL